jgi:ubiquitin-protein ligase E3 C
MHTSFTGSTRKTRQVNLSGRNPTNPWAALNKPGSAKPSASHDAVAQAQVDRLKRQQDRERQNATRRIQKLWRGHAGRREIKASWRKTWDENEQNRLGATHRLNYTTLIQSDSVVPAYQDIAQLSCQLCLLLRFQEFRSNTVRDSEDTPRLVYFGQALRQTISAPQQLDLDFAWRQNLAQLGLVVLRHLKIVAQHNSSAFPTAYGASLITLLSLLCETIPEETAEQSEIYFDGIVSVLEATRSQSWRDLALELTGTLLTSPQRERDHAYTAFVRVFLSQSTLAADKGLLNSIATTVDLHSLSSALTVQVKGLRDVPPQPLSNSQLLWQLAYLVFINDSQNKSGAVQRSYIEALSALLAFCAPNIANRLDLADSPMFGEENTPTEPLPPFVREMLLKIPQQDNVRRTLVAMGDTLNTGTDTLGSDFDAAKRLANYALALLNAYPSKAQNTRMLLHQGTFGFIGGANMSITQYFWATTRKTSVFKKIVQNHRLVLSLLREAAPETNQIGQAPLSQSEISQWRDEWKITILFFELYGFILRLMDDSEFFFLAKANVLGTSANLSASVISKKGALPLEDIALMSTFLKNLAFALYWYAADLAETNENEDEADISALFGIQSHVPTKPTEKIPQTLTGNGLSQAYLKGLVTSLLRQLHEIDSRQPFVPADHWLMTDQVNMTGFIPAVVAEEEKRHELAGDDEQEEEQDDFDVDTADFDMSMGSGASEALMSTMFGIRQPHMPRSRASRQADMLERQRLQARRKRQIESIAPRLEILRNLPFFIPFETRVQIFREFIFRDQVRRRDGAVDPDTWRMSVATNTQGGAPDGRRRGLDILSRHHAEIHRESVFEDAYEAFYPLGEALKEPIQITFIDQFGAQEAGIDGGGVTKEFLMSVTSEAFDPDASLSMFKENSQRYLFPNPLIYTETSKYLQRVGRQPKTEGFTRPMNDFLRRFQFLGRVVGKCLYEGILIDVSFAGFFLLKWALTGGSTVGSNETAYRPTINDVREYDEELYQGLLKLKNYPGDVESDFALDFTVTDTFNVMDVDGKEIPETVTEALKPEGANTPVTNISRFDYINRIVRRKLLEQPKMVTDAFLIGLGQIVQPTWLAMFNQKELQKLVGGDSSELDIADLRRNTQYGGLYQIGDDGLEHPTVQLFWKALQDMDNEDRRKVLKFVTSTPRAPLLGFSHLNPKFSIRDSSEDQERLPSTSTCVNLLKLPRYGDIKTMKDKLLYAVNSGAGFDLS